MQDVKQIPTKKPVDTRGNEKNNSVVATISKSIRRLFERKEKTERKRYRTIAIATDWWARHRGSKRRKRLAFKKARRIYFKNERGL